MLNWMQSARSRVGSYFQPIAALPLPQRVGLLTVAGTLLVAVFAGFLLYSQASRAHGFAELRYSNLEQDHRDLEFEVNRLRVEVRGWERQAEDLARAQQDLEAREEAVTGREQAVQVIEDQIAATSFPGNGRYVVGVDIQPGRYRSDGGDGCYWARLNANGDDIIDNYIGDGQTILTVQPTDGIVEVSRCGQFTLID